MSTGIVEGKAAIAWDAIVNLDFIFCENKLCHTGLYGKGLLSSWSAMTVSCVIQSCVKKDCCHINLLWRWVMPFCAVWKRTAVILTCCDSELCHTELCGKGLLSFWSAMTVSCVIQCYMEKDCCHLNLLWQWVVLFKVKFGIGMLLSWPYRLRL